MSLLPVVNKHGKFTIQNGKFLFPIYNILPYFFTIRMVNLPYFFTILQFSVQLTGWPSFGIPPGLPDDGPAAAVPVSSLA